MDMLTILLIDQKCTNCMPVSSSQTLLAAADRKIPHKKLLHDLHVAVSAASGAAFNSLNRFLNVLRGNAVG